MKDVEFLYFEGCPSHIQALENLKKALAEENIEADIKMINIENNEQAKQFGFLGSPSIRINGKDLENINDGFNYSCRIYTIKGEKTGTPTKEFIQEKVHALI